MVFAKRIDCEHANLPNPAWHLTFAIWFSAVWLPGFASIFSVPIAVRRCSQCVYGGVPTLFLTRIETRSGCMQNDRFTLTLAFINLAGRFAEDTFEREFPIGTSDTVATGETGFHVVDRAYLDFGPISAVSEDCCPRHLEPNSIP